jgi:hypothetical protein
MTNSNTVELESGGSVPATLDALLLPPDPSLTKDLAARLPGPGSHARAFVARLVLRELRRVFPQSLVDVLTIGVKAHTALQEAARKTLAEGSSMADVELFRRTLHTTHTVDVDVIATLMHVEVQAVLAVDYVVADALANVEQGRLTGLRLRDPKVSGEVVVRVDKVATEPLLRREGTLLLGGELSFDPPRQILSNDDDRSVTRLLPT